MFLDDLVVIWGRVHAFLLPFLRISLRPKTQLILPKPQVDTQPVLVHARVSVIISITFDKVFCRETPYAGLTDDWVAESLAARGCKGCKRMQADARGCKGIPWGQPRRGEQGGCKRLVLYDTSAASRPSQTLKHEPKLPYNSACCQNMIPTGGSAGLQWGYLATAAGLAPSCRAMRGNAITDCMQRRSAI